MDLRKYTHFSFDLDGTLVHTVPEYRYAVVPEAAKRAGGVAYDTKIIDKFWFESGRDRILAEEFGIDPETFWSHFRTIDTPEYRSEHTRAYEDSEPTLQLLQTLGKTISIITGAPERIATMEIKKLRNVKIDHFTSLAWSNFSHKPHPGGLTHTLTQVKKTPNETLYIGNSNEDAEFAKNAGVDFVYIERKEHSFSFGNSILGTIHSLSDLKQFIA